ncbi:glycosyl hydrolase family 61-domain-containing protein [Halenospora varia]|nr:glycosyl hydrolase family 61-domain-containing protein [Halenospora varia]
MHFTIFICALAALQTVAAHSLFTTFSVDDVSQGDGVCVRMPTNPSTATFPINDLASDNMACGFDGTKGVARVCSVNQSAKLSFTFRENPDASAPGAIDASHKGPCAVYMKAVSSAINDKGAGDGWFKIFDEGFDKTTSQWCTEKLMANNGILSVQVPSDLAGGYYLVRPELLSLHESDKTPPNPQFYAGCAQIFLTSSGTAVPQDTVKIPGYVSITDPSVLYNIYTPKGDYVTPGPAVYKSGASTKAAVMQASTAQTQTEGQLPENVVLTNANWWGVEVASYSTESGCWSSSEACWAQSTTCYAQAPPTGSKNCKLWEAKCQGIQDACSAGNFNGPPNQGKSLIAGAIYSGAAKGTASAVASSSATKAAVTQVPASSAMSKPSSTVVQLSSSASTFSRMSKQSFATSQPKTTLQKSYIAAAPTPTSSIAFSANNDEDDTIDDTDDACEPKL